MPDPVAVRINSLTVANQATDSRVTPVSPAVIQAIAEMPSQTGTPLVPARFVPYLVAIAGVCGLVAGLPALGIVAIPAAVLGAAYVVGGLAAILLGASPGLRK